MAVKVCVGYHDRLGGKQLLCFQYRFAFAAFGSGVELACRNFILGTALGAAHFECFSRRSFLSVRWQEGMAFAAFGGNTDFFSRYPVGRPAVRAMNNMKIRLIHLLPHAISWLQNFLYDKDSCAQVKDDFRIWILDFGFWN